MKFFTILIIFLGFGFSAFAQIKTTSSEQKEIKTIIVDVRTTQEWDVDGHAKCSVNFPLANLLTKTDTLLKFDKIIVVCRSGSRSASAKRLLENKGFKNVENKGAWQNIICKK